MSMDIFCDCSYNSKFSIAGIGIYIRDGVKQRAVSNWIPAPDNNYGEIFGIYIAGILMGGKDGTIYTDSQTALAYINDRIKDKPRTKEQYERHQRMRLMGYKIRKLGVKVEWVKGHQHNLQMKAVDNSLADSFAKQGISKFLLTKRGR